MTSLLDLHCHCLPGLDDGPATEAQAVALARALHAQGVDRVVATPHQLGAYGFAHDGPTVRAAVARLQRALDDAAVAIAVLPGGDVRLDERIPSALDDDRVLTVGDTGRALLLEPPGGPGGDPTPVGRALRARGVLPVLTHPERDPWLREQRHLVAHWLDSIGAVQVTAASLLGAFGAAARDAAWALAGRAGGRVVVASDAHAPDGERACWDRAAAAIAGRLGADAVARLGADGPRRLIEEGVDEWPGA